MPDETDARAISPAVSRLLAWFRLFFASGELGSSIGPGLTDLTTSASRMDAPTSTRSAIEIRLGRKEMVSRWLVRGHRRSHRNGHERNSVMVRLRNAVLVFALAAGLAGCSSGHWSIAKLSIWHCDTCDDFPARLMGRTTR